MGESSANLRAAASRSSSIKQLLRFKRGQINRVNARRRSALAKTVQPKTHAETEIQSHVDAEVHPQFQVAAPKRQSSKYYQHVKRTCDLTEEGVLNAEEARMSFLNRASRTSALMGRRLTYEVAFGRRVPVYVPYKCPRPSAMFDLENATAAKVTALKQAAHARAVAEKASAHAKAAAERATAFAKEAAEMTGFGKAASLEKATRMIAVAEKAVTRAKAASEKAAALEKVAEKAVALEEAAAVFFGENAAEKAAALEKAAERGVALEECRRSFRKSSSFWRNYERAAVRKQLAALDEASANETAAVEKAVVEETSTPGIFFNSGRVSTPLAMVREGKDPVLTSNSSSQNNRYQNRCRERRRPTGTCRGGSQTGSFS